jgi:uncharacterized protein DUF6069
MTTTQAHTTPATAAGRPRPALRRVLLGSIAGVAAGAVVLLGYGALAVAVHGPMQAGDPGAARATAITASSFAIGVLFSSSLGIVLAVALARWASHPARTFLRVALVLTAVSLTAPLAASHTDVSTRLLLAGGHLVAALVVIPVIVRSLRG